MSSFPTCQIFRPSFAHESVFRIPLGNRHLLRHEGDAIGQLSELVLVRADNLQIPRLVEGLADLLRAVETQFRHAVIWSRNSQRSRVFDDMALHIFPDMAHEFGDALDE